jgi:hypothetical protein
MPSIVGSKRLKVLEKAEGELSMAHMQIDQLSKELVEMKKRVRDVERAYTEKTGLQIRNDITTIICKFNKAEMCIIMGGIQALMQKSNSANDIQFFSSMIQRIQGFIDNMKEDEDGK